MIPTPPSILNAFDLEAEMLAAKAEIPVDSAGLWTDVSDNDPGIVLLRKVFERIQRYLYQFDIRYAPSRLIAHLGTLLNVPPLGVQKAQGVLRLTVAAGTAIPAGQPVAIDIVTGEPYQLLTALSSSAGGVVDAMAEAVNAGTRGNIDQINRITRWTGTPTTGQVIAVTNITSFDYGAESEGFEAYLVRLVGEIQNDTLNLIQDFSDEAVSVSGVARAWVLPSVRPSASGVAGEFDRRADYTTVLIVGTGGTAPVTPVLTAVKTALLAKSWFNQKSATNPAKDVLAVLGVRLRAVSISMTVTIEPDADSAAVKAAAEAKLQAFLNPLTGGVNGKGYVPSAKPHLSQILAQVQTVAGVRFVDESSVSIPILTLGMDEVITAGTITVTPRALRDGEA